MSSSIAMLLGAGFSAPKGYPIGNRLNEKILACDGTEFGFSIEGKMVFDTRIGAAPIYKTINHYQHSFNCLLFVIDQYSKSVKPFDYEEFYDFILLNKNQLDSFCEDFFGKNIPSNIQTNFRLIYNKVVSFYLKDSDGKQWYETSDFKDESSVKKYHGFLKCLKDLLNEGIINLHTLNHDIFLESLLEGQLPNVHLSDGFELRDTPFYGIGLSGEKIALSRFTENYYSDFRFYKLHGSLDYIPYYKGQQGELTPITYLKTKYNIADDDLKRDYINEGGEKKTETCWINYHTDFLTGTTSKIERYKEPLLYKKLFQFFQNNLEDAERLIIIGYGAKDAEINRILLEYFDHKNKPSFIVDPYAGDAVKELQKELGAKLIRTQLEDLSFQELS